MQTRTTRKTLTITAAAIGIPLLVGCGGSSGTADASPSDATSSAAAEATTSPAAQTVSESPAAEATEGASSEQPETSPASTAAPESSAEAGAITDPCAGQCEELNRTKVEHPNLGPVEIVAYGQVTSPPGAAPSMRKISYAVYRDGTPIGYATTGDNAAVLFTNGPGNPDAQKWDTPNDTNVDRHGNVFFSTVSGITVISPTENGYDSHGTLPSSPEDPRQSPFAHADLVIDEQGEATILAKELKDGKVVKENVPYVWNGTQFVKKS